MPVLLHRTVGFEATHRFFVPAWSAEQNRTRFGWTTDEPGHPHSYRCTVTVRAMAATDVVMDLALLDRVLTDEVVTPLQGKHINLDVPEFAYGKRLPTCEALAQYLFQRMEGRLPADVVLSRVLVAEDATLAGEWADSTD